MNPLKIQKVTIYSDNHRNMSIENTVNRILRGPKKTDHDMKRACQKTLYGKWQNLLGPSLKVHWNIRNARLYVYNGYTPVGFYNVEKGSHTLGHWYSWEDYMSGN